MAYIFSKMVFIRRGIQDGKRQLYASGVRDFSLNVVLHKTLNSHIKILKDDDPVNSKLIIISKTRNVLEIFFIQSSINKNFFRLKGRISVSDTRVLTFLPLFE